MHYLIPVVKELRSYLKLPFLRKGKIIVKVFGIEDTSLKTVDLVPLKFLSTPTISPNVLNLDVKSVSQHYEHLKNWQLADFLGESNKCIDVLIGVDYYYSSILQFVIFKPLSYCFEKTMGFDVNASFASRPESRLIRWYNEPGDIKEFW